MSLHFVVAQHVAHLTTATTTPRWDQCCHDHSRTWSLLLLFPPPWQRTLLQRKESFDFVVLSDATVEVECYAQDGRFGECCGSEAPPGMLIELFFIMGTCPYFNIFSSLQFHSNPQPCHVTGTSRVLTRYLIQKLLTRSEDERILTMSLSAPALCSVERWFPRSSVT